MAACKNTCELDTVIHFGFDNDDPELTGNLMAADGALVTTGDRMYLAAWTNRLAFAHLDIPYLASLGDDMVPTSQGWDRLLVESQREVGGGFTYPELGRSMQHGRQPDIPEGIVIDTRIVRALGWICQPSLMHWYVDNVWRDLGTGAGCFRYVPQAVVLHKHPNVPGGDKPDRTYHDAAESYNSDLAAYQRWRLRQMRDDVSAVRGVRETIANALGHH
jgi:hypothetical protein